MELSKRLTAVAGLVTEGASVADIGTDHGYIPIHLIEQNLSPKVTAGTCENSHSRLWNE